MNQPLRKFQSIVGFILVFFPLFFFFSFLWKFDLEVKYRKDTVKDFCRDVKDEKMRDAFWVRVSVFAKWSPCEV